MACVDAAYLKDRADARSLAGEGSPKRLTWRRGAMAIAEVGMDPPFELFKVKWFG